MGTQSNCLRKVARGKDGLDKDAPCQPRRTWSFSEDFHLSRVT